MHLPRRTFLFMRHGQTAYNHEGRFQGGSDIPLNDTGWQQAEDAVHALRDETVHRIVASPAQRAVQSAQPFERASGLDLHIEDDVREFFIGAFEGRLLSDVQEEYGLKQGDSWLDILPDDADDWQEFSPRVCRAVREWTERHSDEVILFASHGLVFWALTEALTGRPRMAQNGQVHRFEPSATGWKVSAL
ncbi:MAG: histidine phosphatase family protein [Pseudomonadota bacterium]